MRLQMHAALPQEIPAAAKRPGLRQSPGAFESSPGPVRPSFIGPMRRIGPIARRPPPSDHVIPELPHTPKERGLPSPVL
ncbi:hypothetical protein GCM10023213_17330 [Prosthecobacter algae]|uniref:Uncharacterized protein n=1 Tax=Prosthecobacter algae TaxID=1144682 RepID=A0ABP9P0P6_9BACT